MRWEKWAKSEKELTTIQSKTLSLTCGSGVVIGDLTGGGDVIFVRVCETRQHTALLAYARYPHQGVPRGTGATVGTGGEGHRHFRVGAELARIRVGEVIFPGDETTRGNHRRA